MEIQALSEPSKALCNIKGLFLSSHDWHEAILKKNLSGVAGGK